MIKTLWIAALASLVGCARTAPLVVGPEHPASPNAALAPLPPRSATLSLSQPSAADPPQNADPSEHSGHATHSVHGPSSAAAPTATEPAASQPSASKPYVCPMHEDVTSDKPGKCPKCKMNLVRKERGR